MDFISKNKKFKKYFKIKQKNINRFPKLNKNCFGLQVLKYTSLKVEHLNICLKILKKNLKLYNKIVKITFKLFPDTVVTKKPKDIRMGRGKGIAIYKINPIKAGSLIFELSNISEKIAKNAILACSKKISVPSKFIKTKNI